MKPHLARGVVISAAAAAALYLGFSLFAGGSAVVAAIAAVGGPTLALALTLSLVNYALRTVRWRLYLETLGYRISWRSAEAIYLAGFAFTATPGKAGELLRGVFLEREGVPFRASTAVFLSERLADLVGVLMIALPGAAAYPKGWLIVALGLLMIGAISGALSHVQGLKWANSALEHAGFRFAAKFASLTQLLIEARRCHEPRTLAIGLVVSLAAWSAEALAFYLVLRRMGVDIGIGFAMSVYALSMLAGAISFLPGGIGGAEAVMMGLLLLAGASQPTAVAATLLIRLTTLWCAVAIGVIALVVERRRLWPQTVAAKVQSDRSPNSVPKRPGAPARAEAAELKPLGRRRRAARST